MQQILYINKILRDEIEKKIQKKVAIKKGLNLI
jgi:hypothetical protein